MTEPRRVVGMGEGIVLRGPEASLIAPGLGSCVALMFHHVGSQIGAMAHIMLPKALEDGARPYKFADSAIPALIQQFEGAGGNVRTATVKLVGGAQMFKVAPDGPLNIGRRNVEAVTALLSGLGLRIHARDVGGNFGRTVTLEVATGRTVVRIAGKQEYEV